MRVSREFATLDRLNGEMALVLETGNGLQNDEAPCLHVSSLSVSLQNLYLLLPWMIFTVRMSAFGLAFQSLLCCTSALLLLFLFSL